MCLGAYHAPPPLLSREPLFVESRARQHSKALDKTLQNNLSELKIVATCGVKVRSKAKIRRFDFLGPGDQDYRTWWLKLRQNVAKDMVSPRPAGPLDFPPPAGGGRRLNAPMISAPGRRREKRKAAFESSRKITSKSFRSFFGSGQNWGLQASKFQNFPKRVFDDKILILEIEQRFWYHRICLVKARRTIYKITLIGQGQSLTSGQVRPRSHDDRNGSSCISVDSPGRDERTDTNPTSLSLFD